ncbi:MAG: hypothetical protein ACYC0V_18290 [Armatimonadota bacterium]
MKKVADLLIVVLILFLLNGCGVMRTLTTKYFTFSYNVGDPPAIDSPVGTPNGDPLVVATHADIADDLIKKFDKYNGGIDWAGMKFTAELKRGTQMNLKMLASITPPTGSGMSIVIPSDAVQIEDISLTAAQSIIIRDETIEGNRNEPLRKFISDMLQNSSGNLRVYIYFVTATPDGGKLVVTNISINGKAHGSLF